MTMKERAAIKAWNIAQGKAYDEAQAAYFALREKYVKLNGIASCEYSEFIREVATCTKTTATERTKDIYAIIRYHEASGRFEALREYIASV